MRSRPLLAVVAVALASLIAGCSGIPTSGRVVEAAPVPAQQPPAYVSRQVPPPRAGMDETGIVHGFVGAMAHYVPGYETAREYLAPEARTEWDPGVQTTVYDGARGLTVTRIDEGQVRLSATLVATVGSDGSYAKAPGGERLDLDLRLQQVDGEWRLTNPPAGVLMSETEFFNEFGSYDLFFFDPEFRVLVPDPIYLPKAGSLSTLLTEALLRGPSQWLSPAVRTAFPTGTGLSLRSVPVVGNTAEVDLTAHALAANAQQREQMMAQLAWTLRQVPGIQRVEVDVGGVPLVGSSSQMARPVTGYRQYDANVLASEAPVYAIRDGVVVSVTGDKTEPVGGPFGTDGIRAGTVAVDLRTTRVAVVDESRTAAYVADFRGDDAPAAVASGHDLARPAWDRGGRLWLVDRTGGGSSVITVGREGMVEPVALGDLAALRIESLALSLDGTRVAILVNEPDRSRVLLGLVLRNAERGIEISGLREVPVGLDRVLDIGWADATQLAVLAAAADDPPQVFIVELSGRSTAARGQVGDAVSLAAAPDQPLVVGTRSGALLRQDVALRWGAVGDGSHPSYPG